AIGEDYARSLPPKSEPRLPIPRAWRRAHALAGKPGRDGSAIMIGSMLTGADSLLGARVSRAELVARELEREITDERQPGERLGTKEDLRKRFGVAVATVNEAVR